MANPELLKIPFAQDGDKATIPETTDGSTGIFSQQYGFQSINSLPLQAGGKAVRREDFNGAFNLLSNIAFYAQKGFSFEWDATQSYFKGCVVIDPADDNRYECVADVAAGGDAPHLDTDNWRRYTLGDGVPIATILAYSSNGNLPSGYLLCDGSAVSRTMYPDLFAAIGTTYGAGDGSTTFNVPDYNTAQRFAQGSTVAGTVKQPGLPNITGTFSNNGAVASSSIGSPGTPATGALISAPGSYLNVASTGAGKYRTYAFDASLSNPIYGNSDTVQPESLTVRYIIKAFDGQTADSALIDITQYAQRLEQKADRSLSNLTDAGKAFTFPSDTYISTGMTAQGDTFVAPADGYVTASLSRDASTNASVMLRISNLDSRIIAMVSHPATKATVSVYVPVKKGQTVEITTTNNGTTSVVSQFIYAQGEVPA